MLRSIQTGQPVRGALRAATQALVLPALLLLEVCESTAASFRRLLVEQVAGAAPLRVPRYVATGQVLRRYDRLESLGRALLYHTPGPFLAEEFLGCAELQLGLYAVVTVGHLLLLGCNVSAAPPTAAAAGAGAGSSAAAAAGSGAAPAPQQQQQNAVHVQYKRPELLLVLDVRDVMMVAVEGSSVRLLCLAGDHPGHAVASSMAAATAAAAWDSESAAGGSSDELDIEDEYGGSASAARQARPAAAAAHNAAAAGADGDHAAVAAAAGPSEGEAAAGAGLRELVLATRQYEELGVAGSVALGSVGVGSLEEQAGSGISSSRNRISSRLVSSRMVGLSAQAAAPGVADVAAAAAAAGAAAAASSSSTMGLLGGQGSAGAEEGLGFGGVGFAGGGKWFVGHTVPCGSEAAARQLQQLLQQACQRLDSLIASSAWQRQLLL
jgi:hypothetical protein